MTIEQFSKILKEEFGVEADYPFANEWKPSPVWRHTANKKWFAIGMFISKNKVTTSSSEKVWCVCVKCDPIFKNSFLSKKGIYPAYHMNKEHWISILLDEVSESDAIMLVEQSFDLTKPKFRKK